QGELEHCRVKRFYSRTNKNAFTHAIAKHQQHERLLHRNHEENRVLATAGEGSIAQASSKEGEQPSLHFVDQELLPNCPPEAHYQIAQSKKYYWDISAWLSQNRNDVALKDFLPKLKNHILGCLFGNNNKEFTQVQCNGLVFIHNCIYRHKVLHINYTTYDLWREQDSINPHTHADINPRTHADIMVLSHKDDSNDNAYPYWYARVIGVFHVEM
ncbi:hypothetical protein OG21DRAFT_1573656, partial [Imleria badia]